MKPIRIVISAFMFCLGFVTFLMGFVSIPFAVIGVFVIVVTQRSSAMSRKRKRAQEAAAAAQETGDE